MMKITPKITELLFDISELEDSQNVHYLNSELTDLRNNLLKLYRVTDNASSRAKIIAIMSEAGYPWFEKLALVNKDKNASVEMVSLDFNKSAANEEPFMSEGDFLGLLPVNSYFH